MDHRIEFKNDVNAHSYEDKLERMRKLEQYQFRKSSVIYEKHPFIIARHYFFRLHYVHNEASQKEALKTQPTRSKMDSMYDRYVQNRIQGKRFISERPELLLANFIALCCVNISASEMSQEAVFDLFSTDETEIRKIFNLSQK